MHVVLKRLIDIVFVFCVLAIIWPILLFVTLWLQFANKGAGAFFYPRATREEWEKIPSDKVQDNDGRTGFGRQVVAGC